jgi:2-phosphoglycerate kinase
MSKIMVEHTTEKSHVPFLRGILVQSLQDAGLDFKHAHNLANDIRDRIGNRSRITTAELEQRVMKKLGQLDNPEYRQRYADRAIPRLIQVETDDGHFAEFSPTEYRHNLEAIGLKSGEALMIVAAVSEHLGKRKTDQVTAKYIAYFTYRLLRKSKELGPAVARRWLVWRDFIYSGRPLVILLGGAPGTGKSTIAADLASRLNIVRTQSTDMLREVMRSIISASVQPLLHQSSFVAWKVLGTAHSPDANPDDLLVAGFSRQADILSSAIEAVVQRAVRESVSLIIEGVHIHPAGIAPLLHLNNAVVVPVMLALPSAKALRRRITGRSSDAPERRAAHYLEHFDSIWKLQSWLLAEADQAAVPIIINEDREHVFREIMLTIIEQLEKEFDKTPEEVFG